MTTYEPHETKLAHEIAGTLNDWEALPFHLDLTRKYSEALLRKTLAHVMSLDESQIKKSRAALFTYLVTRNGRKRDSHSTNYDGPGS